MKYILICDKNDKVCIFNDGNTELLNNFLKKNSKEISKENYFTEDEFGKFNLYRHIANSDKSDEEFEEYSLMLKRIGLPKPNRNSTKRPLHEK